MLKFAALQLLFGCATAFVHPGARVPVNFQGALVRSRLPSTPTVTPPRHKFLSATISASALAASDDTPVAAEAAEGGKASSAASIFNLVKSIVGAGVLSISAGVAGIGDVGGSLIPAGVLLLIMGAFSAYTFSSIGKLCDLNDAETYQEAWAKTVGERSAIVVGTACTVTPILACLAYSIIIGDTFSTLARTLGATGIYQGRRFWISALTAFALVPLCSLRSLAALASTSLLGTAGVFYTAAFMILRCFDGTYAKGGRYLSAMLPAMKPVFGARGNLWCSPSLFKLLSILSTAFMAHFNAPQFWGALERRTEARFNKVVGVGFGVSALLSGIIMAAGFATFGGAASGLILNNYADTDKLATVARAVFAFSVVFTFPLVFSGVKGGVRSTMKALRGGEAPPEGLVVGLPLALITTTALCVSDVGLVSALTGALCGSAVIYMFPAMIHLSTSAKRKAAGLSPVGGAAERALNVAMIPLGAVLGILGCVVSLKG